MPTLYAGRRSGRKKTQDFKNWLIFSIMAGLMVIVSQPEVGRLKDRFFAEKIPASDAVGEPRPVFSAMVGNLKERLWHPRQDTASAPHLEEIHHGLCVAAMTGDLEKTRELLGSGVNPNAKDAFGIRALVRAVTWGHIEIVKLFLAYGADINADDRQGMTPVMLAASQGDVEMARLLLANGADVHARRDDGEGALSLARQNGFTDVARLLQDWIRGRAEAVGGRDLKIEPVGSQRDAQTDRGLRTDFDTGKNSRGREVLNESGDTDPAPGVLQRPLFAAPVKVPGKKDAQPWPWERIKSEAGGFFRLAFTEAENFFRRNFSKSISSGPGEDENVKLSRAVTEPMGLRPGEDENVKLSRAVTEPMGLRPGEEKKTELWGGRWRQVFEEQLGVFRQRCAGLWESIRAQLRDDEPVRKSMVISVEPLAVDESSEPSPAWTLEKFKTELETLQPLTLGAQEEENTEPSGDVSSGNEVPSQSGSAEAVSGLKPSGPAEERVLPVAEETVSVPQTPAVPVQPEPRPVSVRVSSKGGEPAGPDSGIKKISLLHYLPDEPAAPVPAAKPPVTAGAFSAPSPSASVFAREARQRRELQVPAPRGARDDLAGFDYQIPSRIASGDGVTGTPARQRRELQVPAPRGVRDDLAGFDYQIPSRIASGDGVVGKPPQPPVFVPGSNRGMVKKQGHDLAARLEKAAAEISAPVSAPISEEFSIFTVKPARARVSQTPVSRAGPRPAKKSRADSAREINRITPFGVTKLAYAAKMGDLEWVRSLLASGADVNVKGDLNMTALMLAAQDGHAKVVKLLLQHGADVNARNIVGQTALKLAMLKENSRVVSSLKEYGARV